MSAGSRAADLDPKRVDDEPFLDLVADGQLEAMELVLERLEIGRAVELGCIVGVDVVAFVIGGRAARAAAADEAAVLAIACPRSRGAGPVETVDCSGRRARRACRRPPGGCGDRGWGGLGAVLLDEPRANPRRTRCQRLSLVSPLQSARSAAWVSSKMMGRSHFSMIAGTSLPLRSASVASARTQRDWTERGDHRTTTALAAFELALDDLVEGLAGLKRRVPPHAEPFVGEAFGEMPRRGPVLAAV